jgi:hypothetical protein
MQGHCSSRVALHPLVPSVCSCAVLWCCVLLLAVLLGAHASAWKNEASSDDDPLSAVPVSLHINTRRFHCLLLSRSLVVHDEVHRVYENGVTQIVGGRLLCRVHRLPTVRCKHEWCTYRAAQLTTAHSEASYRHSRQRNTATTGRAGRDRGSNGRAIAEETHGACDTQRASTRIAHASAATVIGTQTYRTQP